MGLRFFKFFISEPAYQEAGGKKPGFSSLSCCCCCCCLLYLIQEDNGGGGENKTRPNKRSFLKYERSAREKHSAAVCLFKILSPPRARTGGASLGLAEHPAELWPSHGALVWPLSAAKLGPARLCAERNHWQILGRSHRGSIHTRRKGRGGVGFWGMGGGEKKRK